MQHVCLFWHIIFAFLFVFYHSLFLFLPLGTFQPGLHRGEQTNFEGKTEARDWMTLERPWVSICLDSLATGDCDTESLL